MANFRFNNIAFIGKTWPDSSASAAGTRMLDIISILKPHSETVHFASSAIRQDTCDRLDDLVCHNIELNNDSFNDWITEINPDLVIFDRFMIEEQFGWRVSQCCPKAIRVLDTSDFHGLRHAREQAIKSGGTPDIFNDISLREYAAIARCDLTLMISNYEVTLLTDQFSISRDYLWHVPFLQKAPDRQSVNGFAGRNHVMFVGGFKHAPNVDAVRWLYNEIWPLVRQQLADVECHIYGPYAPGSITQLHQPKKGFFIKNRAENIRITMQHYRLNLATLRYGAGNKGKVIDGWVTGTPTITTQIAAEGMSGNTNLLPQPSDEPESIARQIITLFTDEPAWNDARDRGIELLLEHNDPSLHAKLLIQKLTDISDNLDNYRHRNMLGRLLQKQQFRAEEYMSRWIDLKNRQ